MQRTSEQGFTLIELSVVLVIIGLIVGGVLVAQGLIHNAQIQSVIKEEVQFETAVNTFRGKYDCLPGDCANASQFFSGAFNGNGNGMVCATINDPGCNTQNEVMAVAQHLSMAGLVEWPLSTPMDTSVTVNGTNELSPGRNIFGSPSWPAMGWAMQSANSITSNTSPSSLCTAAINTPSNEIFFISGSWSNSVAMPVTLTPFLITGVDAYAIDVKIDDGLPYTGRVQAESNQGYSDFYTNITSCSNTLSALAYDVSTSKTGPGLVFLPNF